MSDKKKVQEVTSATTVSTSPQPVAPSQPVAPAQPKKSGSCLKIALILVALFFVLILCGATIFCVYWFVIRDKDKETDNNGEKQSCTYNKAEYEDGDSFDSTDGCNTCSCEDGSVVCTEMDCDDEETTSSTTVLPDKTPKDVSFELLGDFATGLYPFNLSFTAKVPQTADVDESLNTVTASNGAPNVTISGDGYLVTISEFYEAYPFEYVDYEEVFTHTDFGKIYRVAAGATGTLSYTTDIEFSQAVCEAGDPFTSNAPCGTGMIDFGDGYFYASCDAYTAQGLEVCDNVVKSLAVTKVDL